MRKNVIVIGVVLAIVVAFGAFAQDKPASPAAGTPKGSSMMASMNNGMMGSMMSEDKAIMTERRAMMDEMDAATARLDELVGRMNTATEASKLDAMAGVVAELVAQQKRDRHVMMSMGPGMMQHMMAHMRPGTVSGMEKSMSMCPMMGNGGATKSGEPKAGETKSGETKSGGVDHSKHHPGLQR